MIRGAPKFNGLALGEGTFTFLTPTIGLKVKAAFVDNTTGKTHGWTETTGGWSKETLQKLDELRQCIERDLAAVHFDGADGGVLQSSRAPDAPLGLGEHLEERDAPQV